MITQGLVILINYASHVAPGLVLFGVWFALTPRALTAMRILILLAAFVLMRDAMTPLGLWVLSREVQVAFSANAFVLAVLGGLSVLLIMLLARIAPQLWRLVRWTIGNPVVGLGVGLVVGCLIGVPLRVYQGIEASDIHGYWVWLPGMVVLMVRSSFFTHGAGAATNPTRKPVATLLENPPTYTVHSGAKVASGGGASAARNA